VVIVSSKFVSIQFWYLLLIFIVTFFGALLQYKGHFATTAFATLFLNVSIIFGLLISKGASKRENSFNSKLGSYIRGFFTGYLYHIFGWLKSLG